MEQHDNMQPKTFESEIAAMSAIAIPAMVRAAPRFQETLEQAKRALADKDVPVDEPNDLFFAMTPALRRHAIQTSDFASGEYVNLSTPGPFGIDRMWRWAGINWTMHTDLPGINGSREKSYLFHRNAVGRTVLPTGEVKAAVLQPDGVIAIEHDGSDYRP